MSVAAGSIAQPKRTLCCKTPALTSLAYIPSSHATHPGKLRRHPRPWPSTKYGGRRPAKALPRLLLLRLEGRAEPWGRLLLRLLRLLEGHHGPRCACCARWR